ncbi:MAG TPA: META domain-containing protein [Hymenobacter sp.]|jgi:heat shock protein HslJ|uniref:META domain-containing protein n=1 Tax=Hymenobacter sp. TaxID=1898978 RepID=UPI002EDB2018
MRNVLTHLLCLGAALALGNCQDKNDDTSNLTNRRWMLKEIDGQWISYSSYGYDYDSFVQFDAPGAGVSGLAACTTIQGKYGLDAGNKRLVITGMTTTPGACSDLNVATKYLAALPQTKRYDIRGDQLLLYADDTDKPHLVFEALK